MNAPVYDAVREQCEADEEEEILLAHNAASRFPEHVQTIEKKVLRTLAARYPQMFCAASLISLVGESSSRIRAALESLLSEGFLEAEEIPKELQTESETHFYRFREREFARAIEFLWSMGA